MSNENVFTALAVAQLKMGGLVGKSGFNRFDGYAFADLADYLKVIREVAGECGLVITSNTETQLVSEQRAMMVTVTTTVTHSPSGTSVATTAPPIPVYPGKSTKIAPQGIGGAYTYGRKYNLAALFNLATDDDVDENKTDDGVPIPAMGKPVLVKADKAPAPIEAEPAAPPSAENTFVDTIIKRINNSVSNEQLDAAEHWVNTEVKPKVKPESTQKCLAAITSKRAKLAS